jgi:hypothetical protein
MLRHTAVFSDEGRPIAMVLKPGAVWAVARSLFILFIEKRRLHALEARVIEYFAGHRVLERLQQRPF